MAQGLMISVAGVRGIVGESLTPPVIARFAAAFATSLGPGPVVIGRDARPSGPMVAHAARAGVMAAGRDVVDLGLATTPATQIAVECLKAAGGIIVTASHNPWPWNALKFLSAAGEFLDAETSRAVTARYHAGLEHLVEPGWQPADRLGTERVETEALDWHLKRVLDLEYVDVAAIRRARLKVAVDGCASVGGVALPRLLEALGAEAVEVDCVPNGAFTRELEPLPEHLGTLSEAVRGSGAHFGVAVDPDADRAAFVDAAGTPLGEEYTVALGTPVVLARRPGPVVTNLSTSRMLDAVCARFGVALHRTAVGEAHVVSEMKARRAVAGGEGNGGMIVPAAHYGRDSLVAVALVAQALAQGGTSLRALADALPRYHMIKAKTPLTDLPWDEAAACLRGRFTGYAVEATDGLRFSRDEEWLHVRPSGTEPVVRMIAESPNADRTHALIESARAALASTSS